MPKRLGKGASRAKASKRKTTPKKKPGVKRKRPVGMTLLAKK